MSPESEQRLTQYLLGGLPPEERAGIEERLFVDDDLHEELQATADDLIHAYLSGELAGDDRARFESYFLAAPRNRERLAFLRDLLAAVGRVAAAGADLGRAPADPPGYHSRLWWAAAAVIVLAGVGAIVGGRLHLNGRGARPVAGRDPSAREPVPALPETLPPGETPGGGGRESAARAERVVRRPARPPRGPVEVSLSPETTFVRLEVITGDDVSPSYDAVLRGAGTADVWKAEGLESPASGERLVLAVPAQLLTAGDYTLIVRGEGVRGSGEADPSALAFPLRVVRTR